ncbi:DNA mismatch repair protein MLH1 [Nematocida major]|uniref:DNA mismatch repair protein MLH1 n=1 Tax=Nematocida major TaxID=1912982 RepID=UPI002008BF36|nr:DNA mismatch repair protein MLH1 [Nematocida major]KAH9387181.1 DNA mismatch repair protein MLH1 [Nematocida major]
MCISLLPKSVIESISAGEVITSPTALVKELLENSLDSGSTFIRVSLTDKLLDKIQIEDNGSGIEEHDLPLLCTRHATSKLSTHEDLSSISTLGFRGEALASISVLSRLSVKTATSEGVGCECTYNNELLSSKVHKSARKGTTILISDLFYNDKNKYYTYLSSKAEHKKIVALITRYSLCYTHVSFEVVSGAGTKAYNRVPSSKIAAIGSVFTQELANEISVLHVQVMDTTCTCYITHTNISLSTGVFIMFINKRLVEIQRVKRRLVSVYKEILVKGNPFIYLDVETPSNTVDVNVHPSKVEVYMQNEEALLAAVEQKVRELLQTHKRLGGSVREWKSSAKGRPTPSATDADIQRSDRSSPEMPAEGRKSEQHINSSFIVTGAEKSRPEMPADGSASANYAGNAQNVLQDLYTQESTSQDPAQRESFRNSPAKRVRADGKANPLSIFMSQPRDESSYSQASESIFMSQPPEASSDASPAQETGSCFLADGIFVGMLSKKWGLVQSGPDLYAVDLLESVAHFLEQTPPAGQILSVSFDPLGERQKSGEVKVRAVEFSSDASCPDKMHFYLPYALPETLGPAIARALSLALALPQKETLRACTCRVLSAFFLEDSPLRLFKALKGDLSSHQSRKLSSSQTLYQLFSR